MVFLLGNAVNGSVCAMTDNSNYDVSTEMDWC